MLVYYSYCLRICARHNINSEIPKPITLKSKKYLFNAIAYAARLWRTAYAIAGAVFARIVLMVIRAKNRAGLIFCLKAPVLRKIYLVTGHLSKSEPPRFGQRQVLYYNSLFQCGFTVVPSGFQNGHQIQNSSKLDTKHEKGWNPNHQCPI